MKIIRMWVRFVLIVFLGMSFPIHAWAIVSGTVYQDLPVDGVSLNTYGVKDTNELGVEGVTVTVFGTGGGTTTTAADGTWSIPAATGNVRVEFSNWSNYLEVSPDAGVGNTSVQFASDGDTVDLGLHEPSNYSSEINPSVMVSMFPIGDPIASPAGAAATIPAILQFGNDDTGDARQGQPNAATVISTAASVGTSWGMAWNNDAKIMYVGAMVKRHAGLGPLGEGGIYRVDMSSGSPV